MFENMRNPQLSDSVSLLAQPLTSSSHMHVDEYEFHILTDFIKLTERYLCCQIFSLSAYVFRFRLIFSNLPTRNTVTFLLRPLMISNLQETPALHCGAAVKTQKTSRPSVLQARYLFSPLCWSVEMMTSFYQPWELCRSAPIRWEACLRFSSSILVTTVA